MNKIFGPNGDPNPLQNMMQTNPMDLFDHIGVLCGGVIANVKDPENRESLYHLFSMLQAGMIVATMGKPTANADVDEVLEMHYQAIKQYVESILPIYDIYNKQKAAGNN